MRMKHCRMSRAIDFTPCLCHNTISPVIRSIFFMKDDVCTGKSFECKKEQKPNGTPCRTPTGDNAYCYRGSCRGQSQGCQDVFGSLYRANLRVSWHFFSIDTHIHTHITHTYTHTYTQTHTH